MANGRTDRQTDKHHTTIRPKLTSGVKTRIFDRAYITKHIKFITILLNVVFLHVRTLKYGVQSL